MYINKYNWPVFPWSKLDLYWEVLESGAWVGAEGGNILGPSGFPGGKGELWERLSSLLSMLETWRASWAFFFSFFNIVTKISKTWLKDLVIHARL